MFLENSFETTSLSARLPCINYKQEKTYKVLKPAAKDLDVLDVMNWTQGEINNLSVTNRNSNELINVSAFSIVDFFKSAHITIALDDLDGETQFEFDGSFWDFLHSDFFGDDYVWIDINPLYSREQLRSDMIDVFYESFTDEMRAMLLTDEYDKALIYVSMPYINIDDTSVLVTDIDKIAEVRNRQMSFENAQMSQLTGGPPVTIAINEGIQETQFDTIKLSLLLVLIAMICIFWSIMIFMIIILIIIPNQFCPSIKPASSISLGILLK